MFPRNNKTEEPKKKIDPKTLRPVNPCPNTVYKEVDGKRIRIGWKARKTHNTEQQTK